MDGQARITQSDLEYMLDNEAAEPKALPLSLLAEITNDFSDKQEIGKGGFAVVYMAMLSNGDVAVKRLLSNAYLHEKEFQREVQCLMKMKHKNIVRFLGYCADTQGNAETYNGKFVMADVQQKLLCFEYLPKGSLHVYITDASGGLEWKERYKIIKGICEGLHYLHQINILHLDLKPANILLDENMIPKITDFGLSRCFDEGQTRVITTKVGGTVGYLAPESSDNVITHKFDLYSLGMIITEILTGKRGYQPVKNVLESWSSRLEISPENPQWKQIKVCAEIGIECTEYNPAKRPDSVQHILERLVETEGAEVIQAAEPKEPFDVYPLELCFPFESSKKIPCSLHLTNNTKEHVAFRLMDTSENCEYYFEKLPLYGTVPPRSTYTIVVAMKGRESQLRDRRDLILERTTLADEQIHTYQSQPGKFIKKAKNKGNVVHAVTLKAVSTPPRVIIPSLSKQLPISPKVEILTIAQTDRNYASLQSLDTDQAKEWILTGEKNGYIRIWNYQTKKKMDSLRVSPKDTVTCVKFIARKQWFVAGTKQGCIHVYNCETNIQKIMSFRASNNGQGMLSLSVHPTQPYLLTWNDSGMKLWDWDKGWKCTQTFDNEHYNKICQAVFNQKDTIASASMDRTVRVWSLDSRKSNYTLFGHTDTVNCLDFLTCDGQEYLVTGSNDQTAKIWDMQKKKCARTLEAFMYPIMSVLYQPNLQILITCSKDGSIYLWRITNTSPYICSRSRMLERIIKIGCHGAFRLLACSRERVVIGQADADAVAIIDIGNNVNNQEQSIHDYSEPLLSPIHPMRPGDTTCKVMSTSSELLLDIQQSLELHFPSETNESIYYLLHLTNKTNEHVAFRLIDKRSGDTKPLFGIVPSISTYMSIIETKEEAMKLREEVTDFDLVLQSSTSGSKYMMLFDDEYDCDEFFTEAKEIGRAVQEAAVILPKDVYHLPELGDATCELPANPLTVKIISMKDTHEELYSLDAHPTEPWIITGHANGDVHVWNHETQKQMNTFKVSELSVCTVKLVARKQWIVAGTTDGFIHVYNCVCVTEMQKITAFRDHDNAFPYSLAVHPFQPYVLSNEMKLWDWDKCWEYTEPFGHPIVHQVTFNPEDANSFASASPHDTVQVWSLDSTKPIYTLSGHLEKVNCLDFFRQDDQQYLITGSHDHTAKIWDLRKKSCIHTLQAIMSPVISVITLPGRPYLVTGSEHGTVQVWSSTDFRLKRTVNLWSGGPVRDLVCLMGSRRVVIGQKKALSIMEISDEDTVASEGSK